VAGDGDPTDPNRDREPLDSAEARNTAILRAIPDLMFVMLCDGTYLDYHARDLRQLFAPPSKFIGRTVRDVMPPQLADVFMDAIGRACTSDEVVVVEYELTLRDVRSFEARVVQAGPNRVLAMVRDVTEAKRSAERNRDLAGRLIASQEAELQRIGRDLHDDLSQKLALLTSNIDELAARVGAEPERFRDVSRQAREISSVIHNLSHALHPSTLEMLGLVASVQALCDDMQGRAGVSAVFSHGDVPRKVDSRVALCLYRVTQEALHNVARHSHATQAFVHLANEGGELLLQVADPGVGFDPASHHAGLGLISMRERVALLRGRLVIHSSPGSGTRIGVRVPLVPPASDSATSMPRTA
jgi:signal transduction histidine kinase